MRGLSVAAALFGAMLAADARAETPVARSSKARTSDAVRPLLPPSSSVFKYPRRRLPPAATGAAIAPASDGAATPAPDAGSDPTFVDRAAALPIVPFYQGGWEHFVGGGVAILDCDDDGRPDLFVAGGTAPGILLVNTTPKGGDITFDRGDVPGIREMTGAYPLDVDGDGTLDLMVLRVGGNMLLKGDGGCRFHDATAAWGFDAGDRWSTAFAATWEPGNTWPTLAIGNYVDRKNPDGPFEACDVNELHRPKPGGGYAEPVILRPGFCALSMLISDWKRDGTPDLRISNDRHYYVKGGYEQMWHLRPLKEYGADWPQVSLWGMGIASRDITGDGLPEVMMTSMGDQLLQLNEGGGVMRNAPYGIGTYAQHPYLGDDGRPSTGWHAEFGDVDNDGRDDLFIAKGNVDQMPSNAMHDPNNLLMQGADGVFVEKGEVAGIATTARSRGAGLVDLNGDGRLDLVVVNRRAGMELWQNATPDTGAWAEIDLRGTGGNTCAVGAWVEVRAQGRTYAQEVTVGGGHVSGHAGALHFGLGTAAAAAVRVIWPDGQASDWTALPLDRQVTVQADGAGLAVEQVQGAPAPAGR